MQIDFSPTKGHEQKNLRPAIVLSNQGFNDKSGLLVCVPCTTSVKGYPFEVVVSGLSKPTVALAHQIRTMDWRDREAFALGFATDTEMAELRLKLQALLGI